MLGDDLLPQPYRLINKIVQEITSNALDEIGKRLLRGCVVDKKYQPPSTIPPLTLPGVALQQAPLFPSLPSRAVTPPTPSRSGVSKPQEQSHLAAVEATSVCQCVSGREIVTGLSDGRIRVGTIDGEDGDVVTATPVVVVDENALGTPNKRSGIVAIDATKQAGVQGLYAVASASTVTVISLLESSNDGTEATLLPSTQVASVQHHVHCLLSEGQLQPTDASSTAATGVAATTAAVVAASQPPQVSQPRRSGSEIRSVRLSPDGRFLAVILASSEVMIFDISPSDVTVSPKPVASVPIEGRLVTMISTPTSAASNTLDIVGQPSSVFVDFFCVEPPVALGYQHLPHHAPPKTRTTASAIVAWQGCTTAIRVPLAEFSSDAKQRVNDAKVALGIALLGGQQRDASSSAPGTSSVAPSGSGAQAAAGKSKGAAAAAKGAAAAAAVEPPQAVAGPTAGSASGPSAIDPAVLAAANAAVDASGVVYFNGLREIQLPRPFYCGAFNATNTRCALGLSDGVIVIHDGRCVVHVLQSAPHRFTQFSVNTMYPVSLTFQSGGARDSSGSTSAALDGDDLTRLVVGFVVQGLAHRCFVDVFDLSPTYAAPSSSSSGVRLPNRCIARLKYVDDLLTVVPVAQFPLFLVVVAKPPSTQLGAPQVSEGAAYVVDATTCDTLARMDGRSSIAIQRLVGALARFATSSLAVSLPSSTSKGRLSPTASSQGTGSKLTGPSAVAKLLASYQHSALSQSMLRDAAVSCDTVVLAVPHTLDRDNKVTAFLWRLDGAAIVAGLYPAIADFIGCGGPHDMEPSFLPRSTAMAIASFLIDTTPQLRNERAGGSLPSYVSAMVLEDEIRHGGTGAAAALRRNLTATLTRSVAAGVTTPQLLGMSAQVSRGGTLPQPSKGGGRLSTSVGSGSVQRSTVAPTPSLLPTAAHASGTPLMQLSSTLVHCVQPVAMHSGQWNHAIKAHLVAREESRGVRQERLAAFWGSQRSAVKK